MCSVVPAIKLIMCYYKQYRLDDQSNSMTYMLCGYVHDTMDERLIERFRK